jgi:hypothetical protein
MRPPPKKNLEKQMKTEDGKVTQRHHKKKRKLMRGREGKQEEKQFELKMVLRRR